MNDDFILKLLSQDDREIREFAIQLMLTKSEPLNPNIIRAWFESILKFGFEAGDIDTRRFFIFFNFSNINAHENFKHLLDFFSNLQDVSYRKSFFLLIYMSSIEIQKDNLKRLEMVLNEEEYEIIKYNIEESESFREHELDELFLVLINLLNDSEELNSIELNHRLVETIIENILRFSSSDIHEYIISLLKENVYNYYLNSYLFYIGANLLNFSYTEEIMTLIIEKFGLIKLEILELSFFVQPVKSIVLELIKKDFQYIKLFKYFPHKEYLSLYETLLKKYKDKDLLLENFLKLFSITLFSKGMMISKIWVESNKIRNKKAISLLDLAFRVKELI